MPDITEAKIVFEFEIDDTPIRKINEVMDDFRENQLRSNKELTKSLEQMNKKGIKNTIAGYAKVRKALRDDLKQQRNAHKQHGEWLKGINDKYKTNVQSVNKKLTSDVKSNAKKQSNAVKGAYKEIEVSVTKALSGVSKQFSKQTRSVSKEAKKLGKDFSKISGMFKLDIDTAELDKPVDDMRTMIATLKSVGGKEFADFNASITRGYRLMSSNNADEIKQGQQIIENTLKRNYTNQLKMLRENTGKQMNLILKNKKEQIQAHKDTMARLLSSDKLSDKKRLEIEKSFQDKIKAIKTSANRRVIQLNQQRNNTEVRMAQQHSRRMAGVQRTGRRQQQIMPGRRVTGFLQNTPIFGEMSQAAQGLTARLGPLGSALGKLGPIGIAVAGVLGGTALLFAKSAKAAGLYHDSLARIGTLLDDVQMEQLPAAMDKVRATALSTGKGIDNLATTFYNVISAAPILGSNLNAVSSIVDKAARTATALGAETDEIALAMTNMGNAAGLSLENVKNQDLLLDMLANTMKQGVIPSASILASQIAKNAPLFAALNANVEDTVHVLGAATALFTASGVSMEQTQTQLKAFATELIDSNKQAKLLAIGIEGINPEGQVEDWRKLTDSIVANMDEVMKIFTSSEAKNAVRILAKEGGEAFKDLITSMENAGGTSDAMFERMANTSKMASDKLGVAWNNLMISMGSGSESMVTGFKNGITSMINGINSLFETSEQAMNKSLATGKEYIDLSTDLKSVSAILEDALTKGDKDTTSKAFAVIEEKARAIEKILPGMAFEINAILKGEGTAADKMTQLGVALGNVERIVALLGKIEIGEAIKLGKEQIADISDDYDSLVESQKELNKWQKNNFNIIKLTEKALSGQILTEKERLLLALNSNDLHMTRVAFSKGTLNAERESILLNDLLLKIKNAISKKTEQISNNSLEMNKAQLEVVKTTQLITQGLMENAAAASQVLTPMQLREQLTEKLKNSTQGSAAMEKLVSDEIQNQVVLLSKTRQSKVDELLIKTELKGITKETLVDNIDSLNIDNQKIQSLLQQKGLLSEVVGMKIVELEAAKKKLIYDDDANKAAVKHLQKKIEILKTQKVINKQKQLENKISKEQESLEKAIASEMALITGEEQKKIDIKILALELLKAENKLEIDAVNALITQIDLQRKAEKEVNDVVIARLKNLAEEGKLKGEILTFTINQAKKEGKTLDQIAKDRLSDLENRGKAIENVIKNAKKDIAKIGKTGDRRTTPTGTRTKESARREQIDAKKLADNVMKRYQEEQKRLADEQIRLDKLKLEQQKKAHELAMKNLAEQLKLATERRKAEIEDIKAIWRHAKRLKEIAISIQTDVFGRIKKSAASIENMFRSIKPLTGTELIVEGMKAAKEGFIEFKKTTEDAAKILGDLIANDTELNDIKKEQLAALKIELDIARDKRAAAKADLKLANDLKMQTENEIRAKKLEIEIAKSAPAEDEREKALKLIGSLIGSNVAIVRAELKKLGITLKDINLIKQTPAQNIAQGRISLALAKEDVEKQIGKMPDVPTVDIDKLKRDLAKLELGAGVTAGMEKLNDNLNLAKTNVDNLDKSYNDLSGEIDKANKVIAENAEALKTAAKAGAEGGKQIKLQTNLESLTGAITGVIIKTDDFRKLFEKGFDITNIEQIDDIFGLIRTNLGKSKASFKELGFTYGSFGEQLDIVVEKLENTSGGISEETKKSIEYIRSLLAILKETNIQTEKFGAKSTEAIAFGLKATEEAFTAAKKFISDGLAELDQERRDAETKTNVERLYEDEQTNLKILKARKQLLEDQLVLEKTKPEDDRDPLKIIAMEASIEKVDILMEKLPSMTDQLKPAAAAEDMSNLLDNIEKLHDETKEFIDYQEQTGKINSIKANKLNQENIEANLSRLRKLHATQKKGSDNEIETQKDIKKGEIDLSKIKEKHLKDIVELMKRMEGYADLVFEVGASFDEIQNMFRRGESGAAVERIGDLTKKVGEALMNSKIPQLQVAGAILLGVGIITKVVGKIISLFVKPEETRAQAADKYIAAQEKLLAIYDAQRESIKNLQIIDDNRVDSAQERLDLEKEILETQLAEQGYTIGDIDKAGKEVERLNKEIIGLNKVLVDSGVALAQGLGSDAYHDVLRDLFGAGGLFEGKQVDIFGTDLAKDIAAGKHITSGDWEDADAALRAYLDTLIMDKDVQQDIVDSFGILLELIKQARKEFEDLMELRVDLIIDLGLTNEEIVKASESVVNMYRDVLNEKLEEIAPEINWASLSPDELKQTLLDLGLSVEEFGTDGMEAFNLWLSALDNVADSLDGLANSQMALNTARTKIDPSDPDFMSEADANAANLVILQEQLAVAEALEFSDEIILGLKGEIYAIEQDILDLGKEGNDVLSEKIRLMHEERQAAIARVREGTATAADIALIGNLEQRIIEEMEKAGASPEELEATSQAFAASSREEGSDFIPQNELAYLHEGEAVLTKADNKLLAKLQSNVNASNIYMKGILDTYTASNLKKQSMPLDYFGDSEKMGDTTINLNINISGNVDEPKEFAEIIYGKFTELHKKDHMNSGSWNGRA